METIQTYLDNLFSAYPRTPEVLNAKAALQNHMEDKYTELKSQGKTENEAIGIVISEFGNIDELMSELNVTPITSSTDIGTVSVSREEASHYISVKKKDSLFTAIGVSAILLGVIVLMLGAAFLPQLQNAHIDLANPVTLTDRQGILAICPLFICIAIAVSLFIISGNNMKPYEHLKSLNINLSAATRAYLKECRDKYRSFYTLFTVLGIVLCILAPMVLLGMVAFCLLAAHLFHLPWLEFLDTTLGIHLGHLAGCRNFVRCNPCNRKCSFLSIQKRIGILQKSYCVICTVAL